MSTEYTPTTEVVRQAYVEYFLATGMPIEDREHVGDFDRWLAARDAEVAARALRDAADALDSDPASSLWEMWDPGIGVYTTPIEWIRDRADRIEGVS